MGDMAVNAVYCGIPLNDYWDMTISEVIVYSKAADKKNNANLHYIYDLAVITGMAIAHNFASGSKPFPTFSEVFPDQEQEQRKEQWQIDKERMMKYTRLHNKKGG